MNLQNNLVYFLLFFAPFTHRYTALCQRINSSTYVGEIIISEGFEPGAGLQAPQQLSCKDAQFYRAKTGCHLRQGASPIVLIIIVQKRRLCGIIGL